MIYHAIRYFTLVLLAFSCNISFAADEVRKHGPEICLLKVSSEKHAVLLKNENGLMSVNLRGQYKGRSIVYSLFARKKQTLSVEVSTTHEYNDVVFSITGPNDISPMGAGEVEIASKWSGELPATGEYRIDISTIESEFAGYELNLSLSEPPASADEIELSQEYLDCMSKSGAVRVSVLNCIAAETQHHDARLNRLYKELMRQFSDEQKKQLKGVQRLWIKYRDANCYLYATPHETGVYGAEDCFMQATAARAKELEAFLGP